jgi:lantibiotic modifying enzyme
MVGWLSISQVREREWAVQPAGLDLYDGLPGIELFLAYMAALTGEARYPEMARATLQSIQTLLKHPQQHRALQRIGAFEGWGD